MEKIIKPLLQYQDKEKEKLAFVHNVESGKIKRELSESVASVESVKRAVSELDAEARSIILSVEGLKKNLEDIATKVKDVKGAKAEASEDELNSAIALASMVASRLSAYEAQLVEVNKKIADRATQFDAARVKAARAQKNVERLTPEYQKTRDGIKKDVDAFDAELKKMESGIDAKLLERYKKRRSQDKGGKPTDIVVKLVGDRCGGCHFELALSQTHNIGINGYIVCEECGRIIYKST